jgi:hypothetical protein
MEKNVEYESSVKYNLQVGQIQEFISPVLLLLSDCVQ